MSDERLLELLPLAALGALDGEDRSYAEGRLAGDPEARRELAAFEGVAARLAHDTATPPSAALRGRVLEAAGRSSHPGAAPAPSRLPALLAAAAAAALAVGLLVVRSQRDDARREAGKARLEADTAADQARRAIEERDQARARLAEEQSLRALVADPDSRVATLAGLAPAPGARGRVVWNPATREAVLLASGLDAAPEGKAYEIWIIAQGPPVPAGVFQVDPRGQAMVRLPAVEEVARVKTFAVTIEPAEGTPAPTGPMVLAGAVS